MHASLLYLWSVALVVCEAAVRTPLTPCLGYFVILCCGVAPEPPFAPASGRKVKGVLALSVLEDRLLCEVKGSTSAEGVALEMLFRRIAAVGSVNDAVFVVCRLPSDPKGAYHCHKISIVKGSSIAENLCIVLSVASKDSFQTGAKTPTTLRKVMSTPMKRKESTLDVTPLPTPVRAGAAHETDMHGFGSPESLSLNASPIGSCEVTFFSPTSDAGRSPLSQSGFSPEIATSPERHDDMELQDQFGFGDGSVLHASMLENNEEMDLSGFSEGGMVPTTWLKSETLSNRVQDLFDGFGEGNRSASPTTQVGKVFQTGASPEKRSLSLPGSPTSGRRSADGNGVPIFKSELSKRVNGLFTGFEAEDAAKPGDGIIGRSPQSKALHQLSEDMRGGSIASIEEIKRSVITDGAPAEERAAKALPVFKSELSRRVEGLFSGFEGSPFRRTDRKSVKLMQLEKEITKVEPSMFSSCPDLSVAGSTDVLEGMDMEALVGFTCAVRYLGKSLVPGEIDSSEESFGRVMDAKERLLKQDGTMLRGLHTGSWCSKMVLDHPHAAGLEASIRAIHLYADVHILPLVTFCLAVHC
jgi:hypothetical protein